ncbi:MAG: DUF2207 domain-containing protein [Chloroflexi bacterium]|nr:MAG: DUF2207 domain-containing protein [Chloroflexota bacterium]
MKTTAARLVIGAYAAAFAIVLAATPAHADEGWVITSFHADINITTSFVLNIVEDIRVDFGGLQKHGIFRTIPVRYSYDSTRDRYYTLTVNSVGDGSRVVPYTVSNAGNDEVIKIGDPNRTVSGPNRYIITYDVAGVMNEFSDHNELYWNVDGGAWPVAKKSVTARVTFPNGSFQKSACYQGPTGSHETCNFANGASDATYTSTRQLGSGEQMSIVTALNKGAVAVPAPMLEPRQRAFPQDAFDVNLATVSVSALILLVCLALIARFWWQHGRDRAYLTQYYLTNDPRDAPEAPFQHEPVVVEFNPPQNLRPAQLGLILDESADTKDVTATIVDLAVRGFLTINEVPGQKDWLLVWKPGAAASALLPYEKTLLDGLFAGRQQVKISELKGTFQTTLRSAESEVYADAMSRKLFRFRPDYMRGIAVFIAILGILAGAGLSYALGMLFGWGLVGIAPILAGLVLLVTHRALSTRTAAGRDLMQHSLGFRLYMTTAEKYRQQFAEKAEIFTQLLPYAIVFGCVSRWAKAFEGIDTSPSTGWYSGGRPFQAAFLASNLETMDSTLGGAISSTPASSGSSGFGGGGFSGGGGGGGGGGSW